MTTTASPTETEAAEAALETSTFDIGGMTCAACVSRVEKSLLKLDGVADARVNLATEVASVTFSVEALGLEDLTAAVSKAGYTATPRRTSETPGQPAPPSTTGGGRMAASTSATARCRR